MDWKKKSVLSLLRHGRDLMRIYMFPWQSAKEEVSLHYVGIYHCVFSLNKCLFSSFVRVVSIYKPCSVLASCHEDRNGSA